MNTLENIFYAILFVLSIGLLTYTFVDALAKSEPITYAQHIESLGVSNE